MIDFLFFLYNIYMRKRERERINIAIGKKLNLSSGEKKCQIRGVGQ